MTFLMLRRLLRGSEQRPGLHATSNTNCRLDLCGSSLSFSNRRNTRMDPSESILVLQQAVACLAGENRRSEHDDTALRGVAGITA